MLGPFQRFRWLALLVVTQITCAGCGSSSPPTTTDPPTQGVAKPADEVGNQSPAAVAVHEEPGRPAEIAIESNEADLMPEEPPRLPPPEGGKQMPEPHLVWVNAEQSAVLVDGYVSLREGMLEMFACPQFTKEHESIVAVYSSAQVVHAALLAVGAEVGEPVQWRPEFKPPSGTEIAIEVRWLDESHEWQSIPAQQWIKDVKTGEPMEHPWVFAGSGFWKDEESGEEFYLAETGDFICVSNFSSATLDIPAESSQVTDGLMFEANTEEIPPLGTPVRLVLTPKLDSTAVAD